jgi:hypothetical protein
VEVEDTRTGERGIASLPSARPVNVLERGPERRDEDRPERRDEDQQPTRRGDVPGNGPDGAPSGVPSAPGLPGAPNGPNRDSNNDRDESNDDDNGGPRLLPSVRKLNNRPGPNNHGVNGGGPNGRPRGASRTRTCPAAAVTVAASPAPAPAPARHGRPTGGGAGRGHGVDEHGRPLTGEPSASQPGVDLTHAGPEQGVSDVGGGPVGATEGGTGVPVSTVNPEAPATQEVLPGWTRENLDQASWDDLADLVGQAEGGHLDNLMAYMDDRQAAEDLAAGRDLAGSVSVNGPISDTPTPDVAVDDNRRSGAQ